MSRVMFHCICDQCKAPGEEYTFFPTCRECGDEVCLACATDVDADVDYYRCTCKRCAEPRLCPEDNDRICARGCGEECQRVTA